MRMGQLPAARAAAAAVVARRFEKVLPPIPTTLHPEACLKKVLSFVLESVEILASSMAMTLLYMMSWLCQPMDMSHRMSKVFGQYILLKAAVSAGYALCVWLLLLYLHIDLAIVFALIMFVFNFVPEVGLFLPIIYKYK